MNRLTKRFIMLLLVVCMLSVFLLPGMFAAEVAATGTVTEYDFSAAASLTWMNGSTQMDYKSRQIPDTNKDAVAAWNNYYLNGTLNWSYEQVLGSGGTVEKANRITVKRVADDALQFSTVSGSYTTPVILYKNSVSDATGWVALKIKAPAVGKYTVSLTHGSHRSNGSASGNVFLIPNFTYETAAEFNAAVETTVTNGTGKLANSVCYNASNGVDIVTELGTVTLTDSSAQEYLAIFSVNDTKRAYLQKITFTPVEEENPPTGEETEPSEEVTQPSGGENPPVEEEPVLWITDKEPVTDYAYSFAVVGDPQILTKFYPEKLETMYDWIAANKENKKIVYCTTLGDITNNDTETEYNLINDQFAKLDAADIPYGFIRGNHDLVTNFDTYMTWEDHGNKTLESGSFDTTMKNTWQKLTVGSVKYLFINMDYALTPQLMAEISAFIAQNEDYNVIVSVHGYMAGTTGNRYTSTVSTKDQRVSDGGGGLCGLDLWEQMYSKHNNIQMVLCGHSTGGYSPILLRQDQNDDGYVIPQMRINPQDVDEDLGGVGLVAMFYFSEDGSQLDVEWYSVDREAYYCEENQFSLKLNTVNSDGTINPSVPHTENPQRTYTLRSFTDLKNADLLERENTEWDLGGRDWQVAAYHSSVTNLRATYNTFVAGYTMYSATNPKWVAFQLRSPGAGTYEVVVNSRTVDSTDLRTGTPMNAYLIDSAQLPANPTTDDYAALRTEENKIGYYEYGTGNVSGNYGIHTLESNNDYILILEAAYPSVATTWAKTDNHANNFYLEEIVLTKAAASIGDKMYTSVSDAFAEAKTDDIVKLQRDYYTGALDMPVGVSLDLNGYRCTATQFVSTAGNENIIDSVGGGVLDIDSKSLYGNNGDYLPLYDADEGGYTFHKYTFNVPADDIEMVGDTTRFWYYIGLEDGAAYDLIAAGESKVQFGVDLSWDSKSLDVSFAKNLPENWATVAKDNEKTWLYVDIKGLSQLAESTLTVTPTIELDGHIYELSNGSIEYEIPVSIDSGYDQYS